MKLSCARLFSYFFLFIAPSLFFTSYKSYGSPTVLGAYNYFCDVSGATETPLGKIEKFGHFDLSVAEIIPCPECKEFNVDYHITEYPNGMRDIVDNGNIKVLPPNESYGGPLLSITQVGFAEILNVLGVKSDGKMIKKNSYTVKLRGEGYNKQAQRPNLRRTVIENQESSGAKYSIIFDCKGPWWNGRWF